MVKAVVVMGVSGCGKTTVGAALADRLGGVFYDGDDYHSPENVQKMADGVPLTDEDRWPWLERLRVLIHDEVERGSLPIVACSALKRAYRDRLRRGNDGLQFVFLGGTYELIMARMQARQGHYMQADMLRSQFDALEVPSPQEALSVQIDRDNSQIVDEIVRLLQR